MYSTDDDLFSQRRTHKQWRRPSKTTPKQDCEGRDIANASDESSDDFTIERDPMWLKRRNATTRGSKEQLRWRTPLQEGAKGEAAANDAASDTSDFEYEPGKGTALLARKQKQRRNRQSLCEKEQSRNQATAPERNPCSSCSASVCGQGRKPKARTTQLLENYKLSATSLENRPKRKHKLRTEFNAILQKGALEDAVQKLSSNLKHDELPLEGFAANKEDIRALSKLVGKCRDEINSRQQLTEMAAEIKVFLAGQLRKGIDKAVISAAMKLNEKVRSDAEQSNEKMELVMKGLMDSYDLICKKVGDMTDIYDSMKTRMNAPSPREASLERKSISRPSSKEKPKSRRHSISCATTSRDPVTYLAPSAVAPNGWQRSDDHVDAPDGGAERGEVLSLQRAVDDLEEKTKQCWFEISDVRDRQTKRHRQTRHQLRKLTEDFAQSQSAMTCKDKYIAEQISDLSRQLTAMEESLIVAEKARHKTDNKTTEIEAYVTQIYDACKTTLKNVDVRYQKLKQSYREMRQDHATAEAKCDALAESLSQLYRSRTVQRTP